MLAHGPRREGSNTSREPANANESRPSSELALLMASHAPTPGFDVLVTARVNYVNCKACSPVIAGSICNALVLVERGPVTIGVVFETPRQQTGNTVHWKRAETTYSGALDGGYVYTYEPVRIGEETLALALRKVCRSNDLRATAAGWYGRFLEFHDYIIATRGKPYRETNCDTLGRGTA